MNLLLLFGTVIKADQRLYTVTDSLKQKLCTAQNIGNDRVNGYCGIPAIAQTHPVGQYDDKRRRHRLSEGGKADTDDGFHKGCIRHNILSGITAKLSCIHIEQCKDSDNALCCDGCPSCTCQSHM